jgi:hypothetical protein
MPEKSATARHGIGWLDCTRAIAFLAAVLIWFADQLKQLRLAFSLWQAEPA